MVAGFLDCSDLRTSSSTSSDSFGHEYLCNSRYPEQSLHHWSCENSPEARVALKRFDCLLNLKRQTLLPKVHSHSPTTFDWFCPGKHVWTLLGQCDWKAHTSVFKQIMRNINQPEKYISSCANIHDPLRKWCMCEKRSKGQFKHSLQPHFGPRYSMASVTSGWRSPQAHSNTYDVEERAMCAQRTGTISKCFKHSKFGGWEWCCDALFAALSTHIEWSYLRCLVCLHGIMLASCEAKLRPIKSLLSERWSKQIEITTGQLGWSDVLLRMNTHLVFLIEGTVHWYMLELAWLWWFTSDFHWHVSLIVWNAAVKEAKPQSSVFDASKLIHSITQLFSVQKQANAKHHSS